MNVWGAWPRSWQPSKVSEQPAEDTSEVQEAILNEDGISSSKIKCKLYQETLWYYVSNRTNT